MEQQTNFKIKK